MKKYALSFALASAFALPFGMANASTGSIDFVGEVTNQTCSLGADSVQITVPLGSYSSYDFASTGMQRTQAREFAISLTGCDPDHGGALTTPMSTAEFVFSGNTAIGGTTSQLGLDSAGVAAGNLAIGLSTLQSDLTSVANRVVFDGATKVNMTIAEGTNTLRLYAFYERVNSGAAVTEGPANATATFTVSYS